MGVCVFNWYLQYVEFKMAFKGVNPMVHGCLIAISCGCWYGIYDVDIHILYLCIVYIYIYITIQYMIFECVSLCQAPTYQ